MALRQIRYKILIAAALATLGLYQFQGGGLADYFSEQWCLLFGNSQKTIQKLEKQYQLVVKYDVKENVIPESLRNPPSSATAQPFDQRYLCRYIQNISLELKKYPTDIIKHNLSAIYLFNSLSFFGVNYGGSSLGDAIYLTAGSISEGYDNDYFASLLHHEISSLFFRNYRFPTDAWSAINPDSFQYAESDRQVLKAIENGNKSTKSETLYHDGFLAKYAQSTLENDFNLYAEMAFTQPYKLKSLAIKYPRINQKTKLIRDYYLGISKEFHMDIINPTSK